MSLVLNPVTAEKFRHRASIISLQPPRLTAKTPVPVANEEDELALTDFGRSPSNKKDKTPKKRNDIRELRSVRQLKFVNLDLDSPTISDAMIQLGLERDDLDTEKTIEDFMPNKSHQPILDQVVKLRFRHYQKRLVETINKVIEKRKLIKQRQHNLSAFRERMNIDMSKSPVKTAMMYKVEHGI